MEITHLACKAQLDVIRERRKEKERQFRCRQLEKIGSFDWAIPIEWQKYVIDLTGFNPSGHVVWFYSRNGNTGGEPAPVTGHGRDLLKLVDTLEGYKAKGLA